MKTRLMVMLCGIAILASGCATSDSRNSAWNYKVLRGYIPADIEKGLNELGADGWTVVSSTASPTRGDQLSEILVILKRHK